MKTPFCAGRQELQKPETCTFEIRYPTAIRPSITPFTPHPFRFGGFTCTYNNPLIIVFIHPYTT